MDTIEVDVAVVGAGPTGLSAAIYTAREDMKTLVVDGGVVGGMIATTERVDNYPGFPEGVGGLELSDLMLKQAERFGAEVRTGVWVKSLKREANRVILESDKLIISARSVLIATGSLYKHLDVTGEDKFEGSGVHYCATCDGPLYRDAHIIAVGGGNSALQEGMFLTKFAKKLTLLVRGPKFRGSEVLAEQLQANPKVDVHMNTSITEVMGNGGLVTGVDVINNETKAKSHIDGDGVFVFIGLLPNTTWIEDTIELDEAGFVKVDHAFATNVSGVFAAGDVVVGSLGQVASAVGEGVTAALSIRQYLDPAHALPEYAVNAAEAELKP